MMRKRMQKFKGWIAASAVVLTGWGLLIAGNDSLRGISGPSVARHGEPRLRSIEILPELDGQMCEMLPAAAVGKLQRGTEPAGDARSNDADRAPLRTVRDTYSTYSAIAVDTNSNEVYLQDENLYGLRVFDRLDNTPANAQFSEPKRMLGGSKTYLEFNCGLYVDPVNGDVYSVANDTVDRLVIFPRSAEGNVSPQRILRTPHGTYGISVDETMQEMYLAVQHQNSVVVYRKAAEGDEKPLRTIQGELTGLEDPHGIATDVKAQLMFVSNHGNARRQGEGEGWFEPPSITVYPLKGSGNIRPVGAIEGPKTQLNWPANMMVDSERGELFVANDSGNSVLVFKVTDSGDVAPTRVIGGPKTQIMNPTGVFLDLKNEELWVSNMGNHRATVFPLRADGNVAPKRVIRSAPNDKLALAIGNPGAVAYDSKREEILVPN